MPTLKETLQPITGESHPILQETVIPTLLQGILQTATLLRKNHTITGAGSSNTFGDVQLNVDVQAERAFRDVIASCPAIVTASSEEDPIEISTSNHPEQDEKEDEKEIYTIAFDPLDGSSIITPNWSVGSILSIWQGRSALAQDPNRHQIGAILGVHGPRTTAILALNIPGKPRLCLELGLSPSSPPSVIRPDIKFFPTTNTTNPNTKTIPQKYFAPANLRSAAEDPKYLSLITTYIQNKYTLRYSGGLVPDIVHALVKRHGIYVSPVTPGSKAKLRRAYEVLPVALVVECAGGRAVDPRDGTRILDRPLLDLDETSGLVCGTAEEVEFVMGFLLGS